MKSRMFLVVTSFVLILSLSGCGGEAQLGHFEGTDPDVSFDVTEGGIENFTITIGNCDIGPENTPIKSFGSFTIVQTDVISVTGKVNGKSASGNYNITMCGGWLYAQADKGKWTANLVEP
jgi:hypothetical protein